MRELFALIEQGHVLVRTMDVAGRFEPEEAVALRAARILQPSSPPGTSKHDAHEELSFADLVRTLRALWSVDPRGLPTPASLDGDAVTIGWTGAGPASREVVVVGRRQHSLFGVLHRGRRTLALVTVARWLKEAERAKHGPDALVVVEVLEEALVVRDGRIVRVGVEAEAPSPAAPPPPSRARKPAPDARAARPLLKVPGAKRWNQITVYLVDELTVRIDVAGRSYRRTCGDLGMADGGNRRPTRLWELFVAFCEGHGILQTSRFGSPGATKQLLYRLRAALREVFDLVDDPFHRYSTSEGWRARFVAHPEAPRDRRGQA